MKVEIRMTIAKEIEVEDFNEAKSIAMDDCFEAENSGWKVRQWVTTEILEDRTWTGRS